MAVRHKPNFVLSSEAYIKAPGLLVSYIKKIDPLLKSIVAVFLRQEVTWDESFQTAVHVPS